MAVAGQKPIPAGLKLLHGSRPGRDSGGRLVEQPPPFIRIAPEPPEWLGDEALEEWLRVVPALERLQLIKEPDRAAIAAYCGAWARFVRASHELEAEGYTTMGQKGLIRNPLHGIVAEASRELRSWCSEFGLSPSSEGRLIVPKAPDEADDGFD